MFYRHFNSVLKVTLDKAKYVHTAHFMRWVGWHVDGKLWCLHGYLKQSKLPVQAQMVNSKPVEMLQWVVLLYWYSWYRWKEVWWTHLCSTKQHTDKSITWGAKWSISESSASPEATTSQHSTGGPKLPSYTGPHRKVEYSLVDSGIVPPLPREAEHATDDSAAELRPLRVTNLLPFTAIFDLHIALCYRDPLTIWWKDGSNAHILHLNIKILWMKN